MTYDIEAAKGAEARIRAREIIKSWEQREEKRAHREEQGTTDYYDHLHDVERPTNYHYQPTGEIIESSIY